MSTKKELNIFTVTYPFYLALKLFGMFPLSYDGGSQLGIVKVKCIDMVSPVAAIGIMIGVMLAHSYYPFSSFNTSTLVLNGWQLR